MKLNSKYHGIIDYEEEDIITFENGIFGFEELKKFIILPIKENELFSVLHSIEDHDLGIIIVSPFEFKKNYEIKLDDQYLEKLHINSEKDVMVYTTVTLNSEVAKITTNLKAPLIINVCNSLGMQIIIDSENFKIKEPLFEESK